MAGEIHDTLAQGLTGIITQLQAAEQASADPAGRRRHVDRRDPAGPGEPVRGPAVGGGAAPGALETARLSDALAERGRALVGPARDRGPGHHDRHGPADAPGGRVRAAAHRAGGAGQRGQARAGDPGRADPVLHAHEVALDVRDDGRGFDPAPGRRGREGGFGLVAMRQRIEGLSGTAAGRIGTRGRHRDLGLRPGRGASAEGAPVTSAPITAADRRRPSGGPGRAERHVRRAIPGSRCVGEAADGAEAVPARPGARAPT